jgi:hypothetical protein
MLYRAAGARRTIAAGPAITTKTIITPPVLSQPSSALSLVDSALTLWRIASKIRETATGLTSMPGSDDMAVRKIFHIMTLVSVVTLTTATVES